jgi:hypothetical protein
MSERDPIRDLENFGAGGVPVTPLSPAEVRRLGDRRRTRRNALATTGAVAAIAAIATPFAFLGGGSDPRPAPPATSSTELTQIPKDFPLDRDAFVWDGGGSEGHVLGPGADVDISRAAPCGVDGLRSDHTLDRLGYETTGPEFADRRELLLFDDEQVAENAVSAVRRAVQDCPSDALEDGIKLTWQTVAADTGQDSVTFSQGVAGQVMGGATYQYTRVGRAVLMVQWGGEGGGQPAEQTAITKQIVPAMCIFSEGPCSVDTSTESPSEPAAPTGTKAEIPEDFPLTLDQHAMEGDGGEFLGPDRDARGVRAEICGAPAFSNAPVDRLASNATGPEFEDARQVTTYTTAAEAIDQMNAIRSKLAACTSYPSGDSTMLFHRYQADTGYDDSITYGTTYDMGTGGELVQIVRVGRAILAISNYGEWMVDTQRTEIPTLTSLTKRILPAMCTFTAAGC